MESTSLISDSVDPLQDLILPSLFPHAIRASANCPIPSCSKDLDSIHHFMKSLVLEDLRSPEKLMEEAKRIVDGGVELLDSNLTKFSEAVDPRDDVIVKGKDKAQERRQGLGIARKRAQFSLKPLARSQPSQNLESTLNINLLSDPDEFFDAYEKHECAKKEIQRQQGGIMNNLNENKLSTNARPRRPGILGKSYSYKHRYPLVSSKNDEMLMSSQVTTERDVVDAPDHDLQQKFDHSSPIQDVNSQEVELSAIKGKDKAQERRQGLGIARKRARFSLKPLARSQPLQNLESTLNIDQLSDPDEFFDAYEKHEYAKKEIQRQQGGIMNNLNENKLSTNARPRRPGILGKSYSYKHRYPLVSSKNDEMLMSSQVTTERDVVDAPDHDLQQKFDHSSPIQDVNSQEVELSESSSNTEDKVDGFLDELLSRNDEDLDGDGALNILQEMFQIKPLDPDCLRLPEYHHAGISDFMDLKEILSKPRKTSQVTDSLFRSVSGELRIEHCGQVAQNPTSSVASPTPPRSPFASLFLLNKRISQSNLRRDPFTPLNIDLSSNAYPVQPMEKQQDQVDAQKEAGMCSKKKAHKPTIDMNIQKVKLGTLDCLPDQFADESSRGQIAEAKTGESTVHMASHKLKTSSSNSVDQIAVENSCRQSETIIISGLAINMDKPNVNGSLDCLPNQFADESASGQTAEANIREPTIHMDTHKLETSSSDSLDQIADDNTCRQSEKIIIAELAINVDMPNVSGSSDCLPHQFVDDNASRSATDDIYPNADPCYNAEEETAGHNLDGGLSNCTLEDDAVRAPSRSQQFGQEQELEKNRDKPKNAKCKAGEKSLKKSHPLRKSLAEAGTSFDNGVRRSKRIRMRPLDYWKGERFIYGRLDESLKLIGVKYFSPGKDAQGMKVKPYVSPQYKELVEMAARL